MRQGKPGRKRERGPAGPPGEGAQRRAQGLLARLEGETGSLARAAEELDRLQARLSEAGTLAHFQERAAALAEAWAAQPLRGDRGHAWLTLVGAFRLPEQAGEV